LHLGHVCSIKERAGVLNLIVDTNSSIDM